MEKWKRGTDVLVDRKGIDLNTDLNEVGRHYQSNAPGATLDYYVGDNMTAYKVWYILSTMSITILPQSSSLSRV